MSNTDIDYNKFCSSLIQNGLLSEKIVFSMLEDSELRSVLEKYLKKDTRGFRTVSFEGKSYLFNPYVLQSICEIINLDYHNFDIYKSDKKVISEIIRVAKILNSLDENSSDAVIPDYSVSIDINRELIADTLYSKIHSSLVFCCINGNDYMQFPASDVDREIVKRLLPRLEKDGLQVSYDSCGFYTIYCKEEEYDLDKTYTEDMLFDLMRSSRNSKVYYNVAKYCREVHLPCLLNKILGELREKMENAKSGDSLVFEYLKTRTCVYDTIFTILKRKNCSLKLSKDYYVINV